MEQAKAFGAEVHIVMSLKGDEGRAGDDAQVERIKKAERGLKDAAALCEKRGLVCETHLLVRGLEPGEDLVRYAEENGVDQIVVGVHRRSKVGKMIFGSAAQYVIINAACPVLAVK
jgi:nucleotide-binding universal stress UspA family protein